MREVPVRDVPCVVERALERVRAEELGQRGEECRPDSEVVGGDNVHRCMLLGDALHNRQDRCKVLDVLRVSVHGTSEGLGLHTALRGTRKKHEEKIRHSKQETTYLLPSLAEHFAQRGVGYEQLLVHETEDAGAVFP